ncbi:transcription regulatory protein [Coprinopsis cinerea okayama7|uniref:Transcription regulatory protein n=1 Tax=Coprinopsis cinerea (strain Okayama-7 / 130 / ATCC MYA-4618 / FGSC 9003) TaxID=240176 RepID=A8N2X1_COPC7|nr:transcription regulatory protein [Coprinopsis cinerea okayama7\|eukprot:XP_001829269.2 transcription regulatory protein [Coprinopsis cinerea okayama7\
MSEQAASNDTKQHTDPSQPRIQLPPLPPPPAPIQPPPTTQFQYPTAILNDLIGLSVNPLVPPPQNTSPLLLPNPALAMNAVGDAALSQQQHLHQMQQQQRGTESRPLNVTDALSYLDAVKSQFNEKPEVYNQFLDIMKDFKSQNIDTPGVIQRVSRLFHGNPTLIQGFNTFLPVGYRIDISADPSDNTITVTTPNGTTTQSTGSNTIISRTSLPLSGPGLGGSMPYPPGPVISGPGGVPAGPGSRSMTPHGYPPGVGPGGPAHGLHHIAPGVPPFVDPGIYSPGLQQQTSHTAAASFLGNLNNKAPSSSNAGMLQESKTAGDFNLAIQYLNKIKARYADDPNTYKQFLDILQTYQKEQRHLHDSQVYVQVQMLFKDAPDLIAEFKAFLPEAMGGGGLLDQGGMMMGHPGAAQMDGWGQREQDPRHPSPPPGKKQSTTSKRKKRPLEKEPTPVPVIPAKTTSSRQAKKVKHTHNPDTGSPSFSPYPAPRSPPMVHPQTTVYLTASIPHPQPPSHVAHPTNSTSADKLLFFDRAKKSLESREVYEEFLKLLSLFSKDIIDAKTLIERAKVFLGDENLMAEFKDLIGWDERMEDLIEHGPPGSIRTAAPEVPQPVDDGEGPSYRRLPESETRLACSGRDELCRSVLNDEWVSHPTWASEESGFVAHKKNQFEDALHKSEEERHEYHVHIEALTRTIAVLEPLCARIEEMPPEERSAFKLKADFGGTSKTIYHRTIKRIYGRDNGLEIIQALQDCPSVAVPVVLARLKQRDEEWKRAQRDWSRTWREVDSKNFYKSLDHQGISFKPIDKKNITAKHFCTEIDTVKKQQIAALDPPTPYPQTNKGRLFKAGTIGHQLEYTFNDTSVLLDSLKLIYSFLDRSQVGYSAQERKAVDKFLRAFIPCLFNYPDLEIGSAYGASEGSSNAAQSNQPNGVNTDEEAAAVHEIMMLNGGNQGSEGPRSGRRSSGGTPHSAHSSGVPASDLRKKLLKTAQEKASGSKNDANATVATGGTNSRSADSVMGSRSATPLPDSRFAQLDDEGRVIPDVWIREADLSDSGLPEQSELDRPFFANTTFYTLLRLLQLLYSRLLMCKEIGAELAAEKHSSLLANQIAVDLGLVDPHGPPVILQQTIEAMGERGTVEGANATYAYLLNACERLFDNEMDQPTFEEHLRWFFGTKAYLLFTIDKVIAALIKQVQTILSDHKSQELWTLLQTAQSSEKMTAQGIIRYRRNAEKHIGTVHDDHLFRIQWVREKKCIRISLLSQEDVTIPTDGRPITRWREYLNTYVMSYPTEWVPSTKRNNGPIFLRRTLQNEESTASTLTRDDQTKIRIGLPSYKLVYESGCEDFISRRWNAEEGAMLRERARASSEDRKRSRFLLP